MTRLLPISFAPFLSLLTLLAAAPTVSLAGAPAGVNHQGLLLDALGAPLNGTVDLAVRIWEHPTATGPGDLAYFEDHLATPVVDGVYSVVIGTGTSASGPFSAEQFYDPDRWLELVVNGEVMTPRQKLLSVVYALQAQICADATTLGGLTSANLIASAQTGIPFSNLVGVIADAQVPSNIARDAEVFGLVLASDGPDSGLNADLLDGLSSSAFTQLGSTIESAEITDGTIAALDIANGAVTAAKLSDGAGSGVDADLLDGANSSSFMRSDQSTTFTGIVLTVGSSSNVDMNGALRIGQSSDADNDELYFDQANESLTWNNLGSRFELSDELRADSFTLTAPVTRTLRISGIAFALDGGDELWSRNLNGFTSLLSGTAPLTTAMGASVNLPSGATITRFSCSVFTVEADSNLGVAHLLSHTGVSTSAVMLASLTLVTVASPQVQIFSDSTITAPTVDEAATYSIYVNLQPDGIGANTRFYGCAVEYQTSGVQ